MTQSPPPHTHTTPPPRILCLYTEAIVRFSCVFSAVFSRWIGWVGQFLMIYISAKFFAFSGACSLGSGDAFLGSYLSGSFCIYSLFVGYFKFKSLFCHIRLIYFTLPSMLPCLFEFLLNGVTLIRQEQLFPPVRVVLSGDPSFYLAVAFWRTLKG